MAAQFDIAHGVTKGLKLPTVGRTYQNPGSVEECMQRQQGVICMTNNSTISTINTASRSMFFEGMDVSRFSIAADLIK